jgi:hypothetical protein
MTHTSWVRRKTRNSFNVFESTMTNFVSSQSSNSSRNCSQRSESLKLCLFQIIIFRNIYSFFRSSFFLFVIMIGRSSSDRSTSNSEFDVIAEVQRLDMRSAILQGFSDLRDRRMLWLGSDFARVMTCRIEECSDCEATRIWSKRGSKE